MKYLRKYNESLDDNYLTDNNINDINDICLELIDDMELVVTPHYYMQNSTGRYNSTTSNNEKIVMMFIKMNNELDGDFKSFPINDNFIEVIDRLTEYTESIGWSCYVQFEDWDQKWEFDSSTFKPWYLKNLKGLLLTELHFILEMKG